jgi:hypothetical protein
MGRNIPNRSVDISAAVLLSKFEGALEPELSDEQMATLGA